ncbi:MAG: chemotaxis protein CheR [Desulfuromonadaceae bacterium]|nr:chemotaxis protein CheR [Desulfuromonadaceae bacterium]MDD5105240.1 chemotaxis protein CheR [Desulfuromonadaceae bacterium]
MKNLLADSDLEKLSAHISEQMGLFFPPSKWKTLEQSFCTAARDLGFKDVLECVEKFTSPPPSKELIESMACYLTIGETYFLREVRCFEILEQQIIPEIIKNRQEGKRRLRIWSAGCATGEEPYSIAIMLHRMRDTLIDWDVSILATDINPHALRKSHEGIYSDWSFRTSPAWFKQNFFRQTGDKRYEVLPHIKEMVTFSNINLVEGCYPTLVTNTNAIDVIFCRNVLMYFTPQLAAKVVERFKLCLLDGGWLVVSPCETSNTFLAGFDLVSFPDATLYRKRTGETLKRGKSEPEKGKNVSPILRFPVSGELPASPVQEVAPIPRFTVSPIQANSTVPEANLYQQALTLYEQGAYREAAEMVAVQLVQNQGDTDALALLCRIYANEGKLVEALEVSDRALAADKLSAGLHYLRAVILQEQGMDDEAVASLKKALYLDQDLVLAHFTLGNLEQRKGMIKESQRYFNNALSLLDRYRPEEVIPESDGIFAGRLKEIIMATTVGM